MSVDLCNFLNLLPNTETQSVCPDIQVGNAELDHAYWGRPENMNMSRPAYNVTKSCSGSDVAGKTVSALASGYLVFRDICGGKYYESSIC